MKLLVIEDSAKLRSFLKRALEEEGHIVDTAANGDEGLSQAERIQYDALIVDWMLPGSDGLSLVRQLRARGAAIPVLMLTARGEVGERIAGLDAGADDYLTKPFDLGELLARVRALGRRVASGDATSRVGALVVDRAERRASVNGRRLELTPREFTLLAYLAREAGRVVPRTELLTKVWETPFDPGSNVIEAHIKNLREKLGAESGMIETVRGVGYRLAAATAE
ncbi:MAG TPA: response regulator transcription factor [Polyangiales bacterium]|nr:response regulator transcription factor [Polyangiales bacterium]